MLVLDNMSRIFDHGKLPDFWRQQPELLSDIISRSTERNFCLVDDEFLHQSSEPELCDATQTRVTDFPRLVTFAHT